MSREKGFKHTEETKEKIRQGHLGKHLLLSKEGKEKKREATIKANRKRKGVHCIHKRIKETDWDLVKGMISQRESSVEIAKEVKLSYPTIIKYTRLELGEDLYDSLKNNGLLAKRMSNYKDGRGITRKYKKDKCQVCETTKNLEMHHTVPAIYSENYQVFLSGNHNPENLMTLCNSCHQKLHYRELGKKSKVKHDPKNGRFIKNEWG